VGIGGSVGRREATGRGVAYVVNRAMDTLKIDAGSATAGCAERIARELGERPRRFAYPYGYVNDAVSGVARRLFDQSVTTEFRPVRSSDDAALLPRLDACYFQEPWRLEAWGSPAFRRWLWMRAQGRRVRAMVATRGTVQ